MKDITSHFYKITAKHGIETPVHGVSFTLCLSKASNRHVSVVVPAGGDNIFKAVTEEDVMYSDVQVPLISFPI